MHMSDALITPLIGGSTLVAGGGVLRHSIKTIETDTFEKKLPLMAVMGAFIFATQMVNFAIPGTGSSGHIGGGMLLTIILGPAAGFITMASVLLIQALFFADGGLLALGCNLINLGFFTAYIAYPLIFKAIVKNKISKKRLITGSIIATVIGLQLGSLGVVLLTWLSARTALSLGTFILFMQPIHLAIGLMEGIITGLIVAYLYEQNHQLIYGLDPSLKSNKRSTKALVIQLLIATVLIGGVVSLMASSNPDGLEWAVLNTTGSEHVFNASQLIKEITHFQESNALMPDYALEGQEEWLGTSIAGIGGSVITLLLVFFAGWTIKRKRKLVELNE